MKHRIVAIATTATFVAGVIFGHYVIPGPVKLSAPALNAANEISTRSSERTSPTPPISVPNQFDPAASLSENIIGAIENAAAHPGNRQVYSEVNELIENLDPKDVRPVIDAVQHVPSQRERNTFMSMLIVRWAEGDPRGALDYARTENAAKNAGQPPECTDRGRCSLEHNSWPRSRNLGAAGRVVMSWRQLAPALFVGRRRMQRT